MLIPRILLSIVIVGLVLSHGVLLTACASGPRAAGEMGHSGLDGVIAGEVFYRERIALPADAVIEVRLVEQRVDGPVRVIAERILQQASQPPIAFELRYDRAAVRRDSSLFVNARIIVADHEWFRSSGDDRVPRPGSAGDMAILVRWSR